MTIKYDLNNMYVFTCHSPILISASNDEGDRESASRWAKFDLLPETTKNKLSEAPEKIARVTQGLDLSLEQAVVISRFIQKFYLNEIKEAMLPFLLIKNGVREEIADQAASMIIDLIIHDDSFEKKYWLEHENIPLTKAIRKYPHLGDQLITSDKINVKDFSEPVRPTINNWIADYTTTLGYRKHSSIERSDYLYKGENTRYLTSEDKQQLSQILNSFDNKTPLIVKAKEQIVIFSSNAPTQEVAHSPKEIEKPIFQTKEEASNEKPPDFQENIPSQNNENDRRQYQKMSFSSPQRMAYEKKPEAHNEKSNNTVNLKNISPEKKPPISQYNVVNLKELDQ